MPPKKAPSAAATKKSTASHASYKDMIKDAILSLKERNGSSRQSIKKYIKSNNNLSYASPAVFDSQFNKAIKNGVEKGDFTQPKGASGPVKLAKKDDAKKPAPKKAATAKAAGTKTTTPPATTTKKTDKAGKGEKAEKPAAKSTTKKATTTATKKKAAAKPKANTAKPRKTPVAAPAIVEKPTVETKSKSGRVIKTTAKPVSPAPKKRMAAQKK